MPNSARKGRTGEREARVQLPFPLTVNQMYRSVAGRSIMSKRYRDWRSQAGIAIMLESPAPVSGPVSVTIDLVAPDKRKRDADNTIKCVLDLLQEHSIIEGDDSTIVRELTVRWQDSGPPCTVTIHGDER